MLAPAIRFVAQKGSKAQHALLYLSCSVKPGVSAAREGITAVSDNSIELCVAAQARDGDANTAVKELIAEVRILTYPLFPQRKHLYRKYKVSYVHLGKLQ
ncbi:hypothetical protein DM02DRAFT_617283 [Periconia macrospinosa]|uniref:Uncharacterized protein n=1 Tax=Periconia macrospinosa TaxID=97972 RepID=A0A2V1DEA7_9PLEO|nr:hypothetical protein DM02DRAFT_617283 [Periconia macrospinosa]